MGGPSQEITLFLLDDLDNGIIRGKKEKPFSLIYTYTTNGVHKYLYRHDAMDRVSKNSAKG